MHTSLVRHLVESKKVRSRGVKPVLEGLEDRLLLYAVTGDHFQYGSRITWSVVPDGTNLGGVSSNLVSTLNQKFGANNWQPAFSAAFATWESVANVNLVQVSDDGEATGAGNLQQGNSNFGDIRIGGYSQAGNILAYTLLPPPNNGGSNSGDIFFNSNQNWNLNSDYDLESVALHEVGLALGMGESNNSQVVMYGYYQGVKQQLTSDDTAGIQSVWSGRQEDGLAVGNSNFTSAKAASITPFINTSNNQIVLPQQDVVSASESYWFKVTTPSNASNNLTVVIQSSNLSELSPKVQLYNSALQGLVQAAASSNTYGAFTGVTISNATPNTLYYIHVSGSNNGPTGDGAYAMFVNMGSGNLSPVAPPNTQVASQADQGGGGAYQQSVTTTINSDSTPIVLPDGFKLGNPLSVATSAKVPIQTATVSHGEKTLIKVPHPTVPALESKKPAKQRINAAHPVVPILSLIHSRSTRATRVAAKIVK